MCSEHLGDDFHSRAVPYCSGLRYLCAATHERVCLHGIEEVRWLDAACRLQESHANARNPLITVEEWPGIDTYDLRLTFADGTIWAADMKDYRVPEELGKTLETIAAPTEALHYDRAWYVIPDRRIVSTPSYCRRVQKEAALPENHEIATVSRFLEAVGNQMAHRKRKEKKQTP